MNVPTPLVGGAQVSDATLSPEAADAKRVVCATTGVVVAPW